MQAALVRLSKISQKFVDNVDKSSATYDHIEMKKMYYMAIKNYIENGLYEFKVPTIISHLNSISEFLKRCVTHSKMDQHSRILLGPVSTHLKKYLGRSQYDALPIPEPINADPFDFDGEVTPFKPQKTRHQSETQVYTPYRTPKKYDATYYYMNNLASKATNEQNNVSLDDDNFDNFHAGDVSYEMGYVTPQGHRTKVSALIPYNSGMLNTYNPERDHAERRKKSPRKKKKSKPSKKDVRKEMERLAQYFKDIDGISLTE